MKVAAFGEIMLRLTPPNNDRLIQSENFHSSFAGSEANVCVSLACFGIKSLFISSIPNNLIGKCAVNKLQTHGVETHMEIKEGCRLGIYFVEMGYSQRSSIVIYDRKYSAFSLATRKDFIWPDLFEFCDWFHFSGITPSLGGELPFVCEDAIKEAKKQGITISFDINYRHNLWNIDTAEETYKKYLPYIDVLIGNEEDIKILLGLKFDKKNNFDLLNDEYISNLYLIKEEYGINRIFITIRDTIHSTRNIWSSVALFDSDVYFSNRYEIDILDRLGAGDSYSAGVIYGMKNQFSPQEIVDFATAASALKHTINDDYNLVSIDEVMSLANKKSVGRIQR